VIRDLSRLDFDLWAIESTRQHLDSILLEIFSSYLGFLGPSLDCHQSAVDCGEIFLQEQIGFLESVLGAHNLINKNTFKANIPGKYYSTVYLT